MYQTSNISKSEYQTLKDRYNRYHKARKALCGTHGEMTTGSRDG